MAVFGDLSDLRRQVAVRRTDEARYTALIARLETNVVELGKQIADEEIRTKVTDPNDLRYSTLAASAQIRRRNTLESIEALQVDLKVVQEELSSVQGRLEAGERLAERQKERSAVSDAKK